MELHRGRFEESSLEKVTGESIVHNAGGPLLTIECIETAPDGTERALCSWWDDSKIARGLFNTACLSRLVPFRPRP